MLGKTAGSLYWMARYLERSENNARLIDAGFRIALTRSNTAKAEWRSVLVTAGQDVRFGQVHGDDYASQRVVDFMLRDPANPSSILSVIKQARDNARTARTHLTREVWEAVNTSWMTLGALLKRQVREDDLPDVLAAIRRQNGQVRGALNGTIQHRAHPRRQILSAAAVGRAYRRLDRQCAVGDDLAFGVGAPRLSLALRGGDQRAEDRRIPDPLSSASAQPGLLLRAGGGASGADPARL
jgi:hypothetical protein